MEFYIQASLLLCMLHSKFDNFQGLTKKILIVKLYNNFCNHFQTFKVSDELF